ncbi:methyltransferase domain-containing protein [Streptacidiphilus sp. 4-A2]|nr:methyltransferase domain-containing protein [Streptacidiphilus sp. 4-A2]
MNRETISLLAHADHPIAAPLDDTSVRLLLERAVRGGDERLLDLGCGTAPWLLRALAAHPGVTGAGVDTSAEALELARAAAEQAGVGSRLRLHRRDAVGFTAAEPFDVVLSVGAGHAFGGLLPTLDAARALLAPGGRVLAGEAFWLREPSAAARELLGDCQDLAGTMAEVAAHGWIPVFGHISTRQELDDYEWCWTGSLAAWALDHPGEPGSAEALAASAGHRTQWLEGYRDSFGFVTLVLRRTDE